VTNGTLSVLRRILDAAVDSGARYDNPAKDKDVKRARVRRKELQLPEPDQFLALLNKVRTAGSRDSGNCGDAIEFFSYAGPRLSEAAKIYGRDCSFLKNEITIRGDPIPGAVRPAGVGTQFQGGASCLLETRRSHRAGAG
jgi:hypothetical protein